MKELLKQYNILYSSEKMNPNAVRLVIKNRNVHNELLLKTSFLPDDAEIKERLYCVIHNITERPTCPVCSTSVKLPKTGKLKYQQYCSRACAHKSDDRANNKKNTMISRYGVEYTAQSAVLKEKMIKTCQDRYGVNNPFELRDKVETGIKKKYGVDNVMYVDDIRQKQKDQCNRKDFDSITQKIKASTLKTCGYENIKQQHLTKKQLDKINDIDFLKCEHHTNKLSLTEISEIIGVHPTTISLKFKQYDIDVHRFSQSIGEKEIGNFLECNGIEIITGNRDVISGKELDIYIPEYKIAIEYCGLYWHADMHDRIDNKYHKIKYELCREQGIQLLTVFEDEWQSRQKQVKLKLLSLLNKDSRPRIYARKTKIVAVSREIKSKFFNDNHIQGDGPSSINIGLMCDENMVACMGFIQQKGKTYLNRYATSCHVIGGFSKLLKHFQQHYDWKQIISFADLRWSTGNLYEKTGWKLDKILKPDYYYSPNGKDRYHKFNYRRKNLSRLLKDFDPHLSERENCDNNGILRIWDCGKQRWVINNCERNFKET